MILHTFAQMFERLTFKQVIDIAEDERITIKIRYQLNGNLYHTSFCVTTGNYGAGSTGNRTNTCIL